MGEQTPPGFWQALELAWTFGYAIALPIVLFAIGGRFADRWLGTSPWFLLAGVLLAIIVSSVWVVQKVRGFTKE